MSENKRMELRVSGEFLATIDAWRRKQSPIPSRAQAIRELVKAGVKGKTA